MDEQPTSSFSASVAWTRAPADFWSSPWLGPLASLPVLVGFAWRVDLALFGGILLSFLPSVVRGWTTRKLDRARERPASLQVEAGGLQLGDLRVPREAIAGADLVPTEKPGWIVRIDVRGERPLLVELDSPEQAEALLTALGRPAGRRLSRFRLSRPSPKRWSVLGIGAFALLAAVMWGNLGLGSWTRPALFALLLAWVFASARPSKVAIGDDGVEVRGRFVPWAQIRGARLDGRSFVIDLASGEAIVLGSLGAKEKRPLDQHPLWLRLQAALQGREPEGPLAEADLLARGERTNEQWVQAMVALARGQGGYRDRLVTLDRLRVIVAEGAQPPSVRLGAAIALTAAAGEEDRQAVRNAAASSALPSLRDAFEALLTGGPSAISEPVRVAVEEQDAAALQAPSAAAQPPHPGERAGDA